jgi:hypothetical protein
MPFKAVEQVMDSVKGAAYIEQELLHVFSQVHEEIVPGFDFRDRVPALVNTEGADMDAVARDKVTAYGKPQWVAKEGNAKTSINETKSRVTQPIFDLVLSSKFSRKELRQAAKLGRPLQNSRLSNAKTALNIEIRNAMYDGVSGLGMDGFLSDAANLVHDQAAGATASITDKDLQDLFLGFYTDLLDEIGSDYPINYLLIAPSWNERLSRTIGVEGSKSMKRIISDILDVPLENFIVDHRLKSKTLPGEYTSKDFCLFLPAYPRIFEILNPVRMMTEEPYMDGSDLVIDQSVQYAGIAFNEKIGALASY